MKARGLATNTDFRCAHCRQHISADSLLSGVVNRNHCPYCLWSRHVDDRVPGDRLSACKEAMRPVGLTLKRTSKKYARENQGELMLIHQCTGCGKISLNRIAADDIPEAVYEVYETSLDPRFERWLELEEAGIHVLRWKDRRIVQARLFGGEPVSRYSARAAGDLDRELL